MRNIEMKNIKHVVTALLLFMIGTITAVAQNLQVSGSVIGKSDGEPLIGATVCEVGNEGNGTVTNLDGEFVLTISKG